VNYFGEVEITRRKFLKNASAVTGGVGLGLSTGITILSNSRRTTDVRIEDISYSFAEYLYRTPNKFAGTIVDRATLMTVKCAVRTSAGKVASGFGSMPLGNVWSFPSKSMPYAATLSAMKALAAEIAKITGSYKEFDHPININWALNPLYLKAAGEISQHLHLSDPIPKLCTLVTASPFDAAVHDAFGKVHGVSCYHTYGPEFMNHDLSHYLGTEYRGEFPSRYIQTEPKPRMPLYHLVSAIDPIDEAEITKRVGDGLPETLSEWINYNGLTHFKIKLNGDDPKWDVERVVHIDRVTTDTQRRRGVRDWFYALDFNERCPNVDYLLQFLERVKERAPVGYERIQYVEQPTARDLRAHPENKMQEAAKLRPIVIDESLTDVDALLLAREMGYTGASIKASKGQSQMLIVTSVAAKHEMFLCGGDMSCPGAALIQSASLPAHVQGVKAIEANARQYMPAANKKWESRFPGMFRITDGVVHTGELNGPGLGPPER
jgi:L-alanine-DL-glutamate epimerase-like enolase superfamily enzyme